MQRFVLLFVNILSIVFLFCACGKKPSYVIESEKMTDILYDVQLAQAIYSRNFNRQFESSAEKDALMASVLEKYDVTQAQFDTSLVWYSDNVQIYNEINDSVRSRLKVKRDHLMELKLAMDEASNKRMGTSIPSQFYLSQSSPTLAFNFDSIKIRQENVLPFHLSFNVLGLREKDKLQAAIFYTYTDTLIKQIIYLDADKSYSFDKPQHSDEKLNNISGYIHMPIKNRDFVGDNKNILIYNIAYSQKKDSLQAQRTNTIPTEPPVSR